MNSRASFGRKLRERSVAFVILCCIEVGLRVSTLPRLTKLLGIQLDLETGSEPIVGGSPLLPAYAKLCVDVTYSLTRCWPFGDTCLRQCLLLGHRLRGLHPVLRIGIAGDATTLTAHSWLEIGGQALDSGAAAFTPLGAP